MKYYWLLAIRPKTLTVSIAPILIASALAYRNNYFSFFYASLCLICAILIQIGTNLSNDYFDFKKGADTKERVGPIRVTQAGLISPRLIKISFSLSFLLAALLGLILVYRGGFVILMIGMLSIISGVSYTAGRYALAYHSLGEIFVFIFFGPVAVLGSYYVQALEFNFSALVSGLGIGFLSCAPLIINNLRDLEQDKKANKITLAVRFGRKFSHAEFLFCLLASSLCAFLLQAYFASLVVIFAIFWMRESNLEKLLPKSTLLILAYGFILSLEIIK